jgi:hypothetical protein
LSNQFVNYNKICIFFKKGLKIIYGVLIWERVGMKTNFNSLTLLGLCILANTAFAEKAKESVSEQVATQQPPGLLTPIEDTSKSPLGCRNLGYQYRLNTLLIQPHNAGENQSLYFFYNRLSQPVKLYHLVGDNTSHSTFLNHTIEPRQWAVLATGEHAVKYLCATHADKDNLGTMISCENSIKVCEFARVKFGLNNRGNFWIVKGNTRAGAVSEVVHYGIIPQ